MINLGFLKFVFFVISTTNALNVTFNMNDTSGNLNFTNNNYSIDSIWNKTHFNFNLINEKNYFRINMCNETDFLMIKDSFNDIFMNISEKSLNITQKNGPINFNVNWTNNKNIKKITVVTQNEIIELNSMSNNSHTKFNCSRNHWFFGENKLSGVLEHDIIKNKFGLNLNNGFKNSFKIIKTNTFPNIMDLRTHNIHYSNKFHEYFRNEMNRFISYL